MRRTDRERTDREFIDAVLDQAEEMFLAFADGDQPYCIPVNYARVEDSLYIHSALQGHKLDLIAKNNRVAFSTAIDIEIDRAKANAYYKSVCGTGRASVVEDEAEKGKALEAIALRYQSRCPVPAPAATIRRVAIIRIDILQLTGKNCEPKQA